MKTSVTLLPHDQLKVGSGVGKWWDGSAVRGAAAESDDPSCSVPGTYMV